MTPQSPKDKKALSTKSPKKRDACLGDVMPTDIALYASGLLFILHPSDVIAFNTH